MWEVLDPCEVGVPQGRDAMLLTFVVSQPFSTPVGDGERRVSRDVVGFQAGVAVVEEADAVGRPCCRFQWRGRG